MNSFLEVLETTKDSGKYIIHLPSVKRVNTSSTNPQYTCWTWSTPSLGSGILGILWKLISVNCSWISWPQNCCGREGEGREHQVVMSKPTKCQLYLYNPEVTVGTTLILHWKLKYTEFFNLLFKTLMCANSRDHVCKRTLPAQPPPGHFESCYLHPPRIVQVCEQTFTFLIQWWEWKKSRTLVFTRENV